MESNILTSINGTKHAGSYVEGMDSTVLEVLQILDNVNDPSLQNKNVKGLMDLSPFITTVKGKNGHKQSFKERKIRAIDDGEFQDAPTFGEKYEQWYFTMNAGLVLKDVNFTNKMIMQAEMDSVSLDQIIMDRAKDVASWYVNKFIPYSWYSCLMTLPTSQEAATYRSAPIGLLKNTVVDKDMLKPNVTRTTRNHYKGIKDTTAGITVEDLERWVIEMTEYRTISDNNLVIYGTRGTISRVRSTINADINKDVFNRTGKPSDVILGVQFIENDLIPSGLLLMLDGNMTEGLTHFVSAEDKYNGLGITRDTNPFKDFSSKDSLMGSYYRVGSEGKFITAREKFMWIDINHNGTGDNYDMSAEGLADLAYYRNAYIKEYKAII